MLLQELIKQVGSKGLEGALHANKYKGKWIRDIERIKLCDNCVMEVRIMKKS